MCMLRIKDPQDAPNPKLNKDGFCVAWKVLTLDNSAPYTWVHGGMPYKIGENVSDRENATLTDIESCGSFIFEGLHLCLSRSGAREIKGRLLALLFRKSVKTKIVKVFYKPEDVVAYGEKEVVVHKLTIKSLDNVG